VGVGTLRRLPTFSTAAHAGLPASVSRVTAAMVRPAPRVADQGLMDLSMAPGPGSLATTEGRLKRRPVPPPSRRYSDPVPVDAEEPHSVALLGADRHPGRASDQNFQLFAIRFWSTRLAGPSCRGSSAASQRRQTHPRRSAPQRGEINTSATSTASRPPRIRSRCHARVLRDAVDQQLPRALVRRSRSTRRSLRSSRPRSSRAANCSTHRAIAISGSRGSWAASFA
jgi:hypothetical protein